jgi:hypothetical protein
MLQRSMYGVRAFHLGVRESKWSCKRADRSTGRALEFMGRQLRATGRRS